MSTPPSVFDLATKGVQQLVPYIAGKPIDELERELGLANIIKLASNENPLGPSQKVIQAVQSALAKLTLYPDGNGYNLKSALAGKFQINADQITLGNGSNDLLELIGRTFLTPELEAMFCQHAFAVYPIVTQAVGATAREIPALNYGNDLVTMANQINAKTRIIFIANPNNPTGTLLRQTELKAFITNLPNHCICVLDEAYYEYVTGAESSQSLDWLALNPNLIITRTFSKAYGLAGLRIGYSFSSPEIADLLNRVRQPFNNNSLALIAAEAALTDSGYLANTLATNAQGMKALTEGFTALGLQWIPSAANFIAVDLKQVAFPIYEALLRKGVIVRPIGNYGLPNHLRISIGTPDENQFFLKALAETLAGV